MDYYYHDFTGFNPGLFGGVILVVYLAVVGVISLATYILKSVGLYTIAKRRGLNHPWLVWLPVGREWIIGSVSDQYQYLVKGEVKSRRKILLALSIGCSACTVAAFVTVVILIGRLEFTSGFGSDKMLAAMLMGPVLAALVLGCVLSVVGIAAYVFKQICMYDLYRSCDPNNAVAYLVLGILFGILEPIFFLVIRKKDGGMPPRRDIPVREPFGYQEPWEQ